MPKDVNSHLNRDLTPFNRGFYSPKNGSAQVNGQTRMTQNDIIRQRDAVTRYRR